MSKRAHERSEELREGKQRRGGREGEREENGEN